MSDDRRADAAAQLYDLAIEYANRSHAAQAGLIRAFERDAAAFAAEIGELVIEDDPDEHLVLTAGGRLTGKVQVPDPDPGWEPLATAEDVVDYYDPVDLFDDVADAIAEAFPGVATDDDTDGAEDEPDGDAGDGRARSAPPSERTVTTDPWFRRLDATPGADAPASDAREADSRPPETASMTILRDLHAAGVYTDAEFAAKKAELEASSMARPPTDSHG